MKIHPARYYVTKETVAKTLGCTVRTVERLMKAGTLTPMGYWKGGKAFFDREEVRELLIARMAARSAHSRADREWRAELARRDREGDGTVSPETLALVRKLKSPSGHSQ
jgi:hypothetical protein